MRRLLALSIAVLVAALTAALHARPGTAIARAQFRSPDAGAACKVEGAALTCTSLGSAGSLLVRPHERAHVVSRPVWWDASTPVLTHWRRGAISCRLQRETILCGNGLTAIRADAGGFAVAAQP